MTRDEFLEKYRDNAQEELEGDLASLLAQTPPPTWEAFMVAHRDEIPVGCRELVMAAYGAGWWAAMEAKRAESVAPPRTDCQCATCSFCWVQTQAPKED